MKNSVALTTRMSSSAFSDKHHIAETQHKMPSSAQSDSLSIEFIFQFDRATSIYTQCPDWSIQFMPNSPENAAFAPQYGGLIPGRCEGSGKSYEECERPYERDE